MFFTGIFNGVLKKRRVMLCMHTRRMLIWSSKLFLSRWSELFLHLKCSIGMQIRHLV